MTCKRLNLISSRDLCSLSCDPGVTPFLLGSPRSIICSHLERWNPIVSLSPIQCRAIILKADRAEWRWMWEQLTENLDPKVTTVNPSYYPSPAIQRHLVCSPSQVTIAMPYEALSLITWGRPNFKRESCSWSEPVLKNFHFRKYSHVGQKIHKERMPGGSLRR